MRSASKVLVLSSISFALTFSSSIFAGDSKTLPVVKGETVAKCEKCEGKHDHKKGEKCMECPDCKAGKSCAECEKCHGKDHKHEAGHDHGAGHDHAEKKAAKKTAQ